MCHKPDALHDAQPGRPLRPALPQITYETLATSLYQTVLEMLAMPTDYVTAKNFVVQAIHTLTSMVPATLDGDTASGGRRRLRQDSAARCACQQAQCAWCLVERGEASHCLITLEASHSGWGHGQQGQAPPAAGQC